MWYGQMRQKLIVLGQMGGRMGLEETWENLNDRLVEGTLNLGVVL